MPGDTITAEYQVEQPTYARYLVDRLREYAKSEDWVGQVPSLKDVNVGEIYDYSNVVLLDNTFIMIYERSEEHSAWNIGATTFRTVVNLTIDIRSGSRNDYWVTFKLVRDALRDMMRTGGKINASGSEYRYLIEYRGSTDLSDKLKMLWRRSLEVRIYTTE